MEAAYTLPLPSDRGSLRPFATLRTVGGSRDLRVGTQLDLTGGGDGGVRFELLGEQLARVGGTSTYGAGLKVSAPGLQAVRAALSPFGEVTVEGGGGRRLRFGTLLALPGEPRTFRFPISLDMSGEAYVRPGVEPRYNLVLRGGWGLW